MHAARGERRLRVALLTGCAQAVLTPGVHAATIRVLNRAGAEVVTIGGCCGALTHHMGRESQGRSTARELLRALVAERDAHGLDAIVADASGCGMHVKDYAWQFRDEAALAHDAADIGGRARDVTEVVAQLGLPTVTQRPALAVAYHSACSLQHGQKIDAAPRELLRQAGYDVREIAEGHLCCGSAGTYNLLQPAISAQLRDRKLANVRSTGAQAIATGNVGCAMQLGAGELPVFHTIELLDRATTRSRQHHHLHRRPASARAAPHPARDLRVRGSRQLRRADARTQSRRARCLAVPSARHGRFLEARSGHDARRRDRPSCRSPSRPPVSPGSSTRTARCSAHGPRRRSAFRSTLSTMSICSIEDVRGATTKPFWFQLYLMRDRGFSAELIARAQAAQCTALMLTVDMQIQGFRRRDPKNGLSVPPRLTVANLLDVATKPAWAFKVLRGKRRTFGNLVGRMPDTGGLSTLAQWIATQFDPTVTWKDIAWVRERWPGRLIVKGIMDAADVSAALDAGVDALVVSNHGGRQLDGGPSSIRVLPEIVEAVAGRREVLFDGGLRSGQDLLKALALGARGGFIGKAFLYALAADGQAGVTTALELIRNELRVSLALAGRTSVTDIDATILRDIT